ncbi:MAG: hypothetical protein ACI9O6_000104 [Glaciecola sp.]|jgi:hypothetical protein|tara:strand:- start:2639 stop:3079 length:441 start_codon:yes stop_codon:yes gene_type:complete
MFSFMRSYMLYVFYWICIKEAERENRKPSSASGFGAVVVVFSYIPFGIYVFLLNLFPEKTSYVYGYLRNLFGIFSSHKGEVSVGMLLAILPISIALCYIVCCYRISFEDIPKRLERYQVLSEFSWFKVLIPYFIPGVFFLIYLLFT